MVVNAKRCMVRAYNEWRCFARVAAAVSDAQLIDAGSNLNEEHNPR